MSVGKQAIEIVGHGFDGGDAVAHDLEDVLSVTQAVSVGEHYLMNRLNVHIHFRWGLVGRVGDKPEGEEFCAIFQRSLRETVDDARNAPGANVETDVGMCELLFNGDNYAVFRDVIEFRKSPEDRPTFVGSYVWLQLLHFCDGTSPNYFRNNAGGALESLVGVVDQKTQLSQPLRLVLCPEGGSAYLESIENRQLEGSVVKSGAEIMNDIAYGQSQGKGRWPEAFDKDVVRLPIRLAFNGCEVAGFFRELTSRQEFLEVIYVLIRPIDFGPNLNQLG